ncbi:hypothetical protein BGY98DRAFT_173342 [Russula aff. rugulosa BPL654]|nr:hypothetical protein BGY98DRAFT_173342 [Russula aff. rugulosa BPL654]
MNILWEVSELKKRRSYTRPGTVLSISSVRGQESTGPRLWTPPCFGYGAVVAAPCADSINKCKSMTPPSTKSSQRPNRRMTPRLAAMAYYLKRRKFFLSFSFSSLLAISSLLYFFIVRSGGHVSKRTRTRKCRYRGKRCIRVLELSERVSFLLRRISLL